MFLLRSLDDFCSVFFRSRLIHYLHLIRLVVFSSFSAKLLRFSNDVVWLFCFLRLQKNRFISFDENRNMKICRVQQHWYFHCLENSQFLASSNWKETEKKRCRRQRRRIWRRNRISILRCAQFKMNYKSRILIGRMNAQPHRHKIELHENKKSYL